MTRKALLMTLSILFIDASSQFSHTDKQYKIIGYTKASNSQSRTFELATVVARRVAPNIQLTFLATAADCSFQDKLFARMTPKRRSEFFCSNSVEESFGTDGLLQAVALGTAWCFELG